MRRIIAATAIAVIAAGCGSASRTPSAKPGDALTEDAVTFGERLVEIRGHHEVAFELYRKGDAQGAAVHTGHPVAEILTEIGPELKRADAADATRLERDLRDATLATAGAGTDALAKAIKATQATSVRAERAVVGAARKSLAYHASVVAAVLATASREYGEAYDAGKITRLVEYQDAYGFTTAALKNYRAIADRVRKRDAHAADEADAAIKTLKAAVKHVVPPDAPTITSEAFSKAAARVAVELREAVDALEPSAVSADVAFEHVDKLLDDVLDAYRAGERERAGELAATAYLDNYEHVEGDVKRLAPKVNNELEPLLGAELRAKIKARVPVAELERMVARARALLKQARTAVLGPHEMTP